MNTGMYICSGQDSGEINHKGYALKFLQVVKLFYHPCTRGITYIFTMSDSHARFCEFPNTLALSQHPDFLFPSKTTHLIKLVGIQFSTLTGPQMIMIRFSKQISFLLQLFSSTVHEWTSSVLLTVSCNLQQRSVVGLL